MNQEPERNEPFQVSDLYEFTLHNDPGDTLQIFTAHTMDSTYLSAKQTLDLLNFLAAHREQIEALVHQLQTQRQERKTTQERIDNLFGEEKQL